MIMLVLQFHKPSPRKITILMGGIPTINLMGGLWNSYIHIRNHIPQADPDDSEQLQLTGTFMDEQGGHVDLWMEDMSVNIVSCFTFYVFSLFAISRSIGPNKWPPRTLVLGHLRRTSIAPFAEKVYKGVLKCRSTWQQLMVGETTSRWHAKPVWLWADPASRLLERPRYVVDVLDFNGSFIRPSEQQM